MQIAIRVLFVGTTLDELVVELIECRGTAGRAYPKRLDTCCYSIAVVGLWLTIVRAAPHICGHSVVSSSNAMNTL